MKYGTLFLAGMLMGCSQQNFSLPSTYQEFQQPLAFNNKVDILIMSDNSPSMKPIQDDLAAKIPNFVSSLNATGMDYHIGVVTTDMLTSGGRLIGSPGYLHSRSSNLVSELQARVANGETQNTVEEGLDSIRRALLPESIAEFAPGFLRADSLLSIIFLSNEDDYSGITPSQFIEIMNQIKSPFPSGARSWVANYIGVPNLSVRCDIRAGFKEVGLDYLDVVSYSGGVVESICSNDFSSAVSNVRVRISEILTDYYFRVVPNIETIRVTVNGVVIPMDASNGWTYEADKNALRFHGSAIPAPSDRVHVDFNPAGAS